MSLKPTELLEWATNLDSDKEEYTLAKKKAGYVSGDKPDFNEWNHFRYNIHLWLLWLASVDLSTDPLMTRISDLEYENNQIKSELSNLKQQIEILKGEQ